MKDHGISLNADCPCSQAKCPIRGNCVLCVQNHIVHKKHLPECMQNLIRPEIKQMAKMVELDCSDARPDKDFWDEFDSEGFLKKTIEKHKK